MSHDNPTISVSGSTIPVIDEFDRMALRVASAGRLQQNIKLKDIGVACGQRAEALDKLVADASSRIEAEAIITSTMGGKDADRASLDKKLKKLLAIQTPSASELEQIDLLQQLLKKWDERFGDTARLRRSLDLFDKYDEILSN